MRLRLVSYQCLTAVTAARSHSDRLIRLDSGLKFLVSSNFALGEPLPC